jgi:hypothetical protein
MMGLDLKSNDWEFIVEKRDKADGTTEREKFAAFLFVYSCEHLPCHRTSLLAI